MWKFVDLGSESETAGENGSGVSDQFDHQMEMLRKASMGAEDAVDRFRREAREHSQALEGQVRGKGRWRLNPYSRDSSSSSAPKSDGQFSKWRLSPVPSASKPNGRASNGRLLKKTSSNDLANRQSSGSPAPRAVKNDSQKRVAPPPPTAPVATAQQSNVIDNLSTYRFSSRPSSQTQSLNAPNAPSVPKPLYDKAKLESPRRPLYWNSTLSEDTSGIEVKVQPRKRGRPRKNDRRPLDVHQAPLPRVAPWPQTPGQGATTESAQNQSISGSIAAKTTPKRKRLKRGPRRLEEISNDSSNDSDWSAFQRSPACEVHKERSPKIPVTNRLRRGAAEPDGSVKDGQSNSRWPSHHPVSSKAMSYDQLLRLREFGGDSCLSKRAIHRSLRDAVCERSMEKWRYLEGASKDIIVAEWSPNGRNYAVSTSTELDATSRPYNKEKNFLWGDVQNDTLQELDAHHVPKPRAETLGNRVGGDSAQASTIVDDRLFTTVSSVCFSNDAKRMFSGSYDHCVKVWSVSPKRRAPKCLQTLKHEGRVELLSMSQAASFQALATAQGTTDNAISVFDVSRDIIRQNRSSSSSYITQSSRSASTVLAADAIAPLRRFSHDRATRTSLYPTALHWGILSTTCHLLLAGFAENQGDTEYQDREGSLCIWDVEKGTPLKRLVPSSQNVFDLTWHPSLEVFAAATTPGTQVTHRKQTKSVIKIFEPLESQSWVREFECPAIDMNEIKFHPTDSHYISAACTNGKTYVWDSRRPDEVLHVLQHGPCLEPLDEGRRREEADTGVRFMSWSSNGTHLYTGSSDGVVKCWNPFVADENKHTRDIAFFDSAVMSGAFSPDSTHLLIGLCKGAVHVLSAAPWMADQSGQSQGAELLEAEANPTEVPEIRYIPASSSKITDNLKRDRSADLAEEEEEEPRPKHVRQDREREKGKQKKVYRDGAAGTDVDADLLFEQGVSEKELSELGSGDEETHGPRTLATTSIHYDSARETPAAEERHVPATRYPESTPTKPYPTLTPSTPQASQERTDALQKRGSLTPQELKEEVQRRRAAQLAAMWREVPKPLPLKAPKKHLTKRRSATQQQAARAAASGNFVVIDDDD